MKSRNTALCGLLLALSAGISAAESLIPLPLGVKPGFSNLPVMYSMAEQGAKYGFAICILKSVFVFIDKRRRRFFHVAFRRYAFIYNNASALQKNRSFPYAYKYCRSSGS